MDRKSGQENGTEGTGMHVCQGSAHRLRSWPQRTMGVRTVLIWYLDVPETTPPGLCFHVACSCISHHHTPTPDFAPNTAFPQQCFLECDRAAPSSMEPHRPKYPIESGPKYFQRWDAYDADDDLKKLEEAEKLENAAKEVWHVLRGPS